MQIRLTMVLVLVGLISCLTVGGTAYYMIRQDFRDAVRERAFIEFTKDFIEYTATHDDWREGIAAESFDRFVRRKHRAMGVHPPNRTDLPDSTINRWETPPFHFIALDPGGRVVKASAGLELGEQAPQSIIDGAQEVVVDGEVVALVSPEGDVALTPHDKRYLDAVKRSLVVGSGIAVSLSVALGVFFGGNLSGSLVQLTAAIRKLQATKGEEHHVAIPARGEIGELASAFNTMNSELAEAHRELTELSIRDPLTELYNRRHFEAQAKQMYELAVRYNQPLTIMVGDLDHFKAINDNYSHELGDAVLRTVADLLRQCTRKSDIVARYGGEEFVILFPDTGLEQARTACEHIREAIEQHPWEELAPDLRVTMSMGLSNDVTAGVVEKMISQADKHLYDAKSMGRNRVVVPAMG